MPEQPDVYVNYVKLSDIDNIRPKDYWIRIPFYIQGSANAHILLSAVEKATELDDAYEICKSMNFVECKLHANKILFQIFQ